MAITLPPSAEQTAPNDIEVDAQGLPDTSLISGIEHTALQQSDDEIIAHLASMKPIEYERVRAEQAKSMGCRPAVLDGLVKAARNEETEVNRLPFPEIEPFLILPTLGGQSGEGILALEGVCHGTQGT
jgi:hypothetical protein